MEFNGGYNRIGILEVRNETCLVCNQEKECLYGDPSDEEYAAVVICRKCIDEVIKLRLPEDIRLILSKIALEDYDISLVSIARDILERLGLDSNGEYIKSNDSMK